MTVAIPFILSNLILLASSYPFGSPACVGQPKHGGEPQKDREGLAVEFSKEKNTDGAFILRMTANDESFTLKGFLVITKSPGQFVAGQGVALLACTGALGSAGPEYKAVTHTDSSEKQMVEIEFEPENPDHEEEPEFEIVILRNYHTFWTEIIV